MANLGSDDTPVVADNVRTRVAEIDDTDSPYTTQGENQLEVDTSAGNVTVTIASADIPASGEPGRAVAIVNTAAGSVTIETEGTEQIQPDGVGSLTIETSGAYLDCRLLAGAVYVERNVSRNQIDASAANLEQLAFVFEGLKENEVVLGVEPLSDDALDRTFSGIEGYSGYRLKARLEPSNTDVGAINMRINGINSTDYQYMQDSETGLNSEDSESEFQIVSSATNSLRFGIGVFNLLDSSGRTGNAEPVSISRREMALRPNWRGIIRGYLNDAGATPVSEIRIWGSGSGDAHHGVVALIGEEEFA